ncbi:MAG: DUF1127 domain-containing protein [Roseinatronobacter sp.]
MLRAIPLTLRPVFQWSARIALSRHLALSRSRRQLAQLDDHLLDDVGLTRDQATFEAARRSWDAPKHWLE